MGSSGGGPTLLADDGGVSEEEAFTVSATEIAQMEELNYRLEQ
jgi:hypothetical protein